MEIDFTHEEVISMMMIMSNVGGFSNNSPRRHTSEVMRKLTEAYNYHVPFIQTRGMFDSPSTLFWSEDTLELFNQMVEDFLADCGIAPVPVRDTLTMAPDEPFSGYTMPFSSIGTLSTSVLGTTFTTGSINDPYN